MQGKSSRSGKGYGHTLKYTGLFGGVQMLQVAISVARNKCAALLIGTVGMGLTDVLNRSTDMYSSLTNLGLPMSGVRKMSGEYEGGDAARIAAAAATIRLWCLITGALGMLLCAVSSPWLARYAFGGRVSASDFVVVAPVVMMMAVYGGEAAILKGLRCLRLLATTSLAGAAASLVLTVVLYVAMGLRAVPWALLGGAALTMGAALTATRRACPWTPQTLSRSSLSAGRALLAIGISYVAAGFAGTGAEMLVRAYISHTAGGLAEVGIYAAAFVVCVTYTRLVFVAMDADYFPRLSAASTSGKGLAETVARQIDVCVMLMAPMLVAFLMLLPLAIRLLYAPSFAAATAMCIGAAGYLFIKAIVAPIEYIPLAAGDSLVYFCAELAYDVVFALAVILGYRHFGLWGAGWALTASYAFDLAFILLLFRRIYGYRIPLATLRIILIQGAATAVAVAVFASGYGLLQYAAGILLLAASAAYSVKKMNITWSKIKETLRRRAQRGRE